jgi:hypothetical protein
MFEKLSIEKWCMYEHISRWRTVHFSPWTTLTVARWYRGRSGPRRRSPSMWCTQTLAFHAWWHNHCCAIFPRETAVRLIFMDHSQVSLYHRLHHIMPRKLNSLLLLFSDFSASYLDWLLRFLYCGARKPSFGHLAIFKARRKLDCSSCTWLHCLAIIADMLKTCTTLHQQNVF